MASSVASLISSMAPDASGLDKIIGIPPGTQMFYQQHARAPHASVGGYGLMENQRYGRQVNDYLSQLTRVNSQRMDIAHNLLQNEENDSKRKLLANTWGKNTDAGVTGGYGKSMLDLMFGSDMSPAMPAILDTNDQMSMNERNAKEISDLGTGLKTAGEGGYQLPASIAPILEGARPISRTAVAAAAAGNNGGSGGGPGGKVTITDNGIARTIRHVMNAADLPTFLKNNPDTNLVTGKPTVDPAVAPPQPVEVGMGNEYQKAAIRQMSSTGKVDVDPNVITVDDGILQVDVGPKGQPKRRVFVDPQGGWHATIEEAKTASGDTGE